MENEKQWWAPVWKGLVMDQKAKHYRSMKSAVWLFLYLLISADRKTGCLFRKVKTISLKTGIKERTLRLWLAVLKDKGYIETRNTGRCLAIRIKKWRGLSGPDRQDDTRENCKPLPTRLADFCIPEGASEGRNPQYSCAKSQPSPSPIDSSITRDLNTIIDSIDDKSISLSDEDISTFKPKTRRQLLALDLAEALNDMKGLALYLSYSKKYSESFLRRILAEVKQIPSKRIKKSRGALFNYLIQQYVQQTTNSHGN